MKRIEFQGLGGFCFPKFAPDCGLRHIFAARSLQQGDESTIATDGNLALSGGRNRHSALLARATWSAYLKVAAEDWVVGGQTHTAHVQVVTEVMRGCGATAAADVLPQTDGLFTTCSGLPLYVAVADCSAVLLVAQGALAVVHGGWRGLANGILQAAVERFQEHGIGASDIYAAIAPCIAAASYEVGPEVAESCPSVAKYRGRGDRWQVDIALWAAHELQRAAIPAAKIISSGLDTGCDARLFSHRRQGLGAGRNGLIAVLD